MVLRGDVCHVQARFVQVRYFVAVAIAAVYGVSGHRVLRQYGERLSVSGVIVMDNATFHKRQDTLDALQAEGNTVLWLPPYSPDFNPIEKMWAWIKRLRKQWQLADVNTLLFWILTLVTLY